MADKDTFGSGRWVKFGEQPQAEIRSARKRPEALIFAIPGGPLVHVSWEEWQMLVDTVHEWRDDD